MGRNAKFYKKAKRRVKGPAGAGLGADNDEHLEQERAVGTASKKLAGQLQAGKAHLGAGEEKRPGQKTARHAGQGAKEQRPAGEPDNNGDSGATAAMGALSSSAGSGKLKSKLWKGLEAQRASQGGREIATPSEVGIDYLSQWEKTKRGRR